MLISMETIAFLLLMALMPNCSGVAMHSIFIRAVHFGVRKLYNSPAMLQNGKNLSSIVFQNFSMASPMQGFNRLDEDFASRFEILLGNRATIYYGFGFTSHVVHWRRQCSERLQITKN